MNFIDTGFSSQGAIAVMNIRCQLYRGFFLSSLSNALTLINKGKSLPHFSLIPRIISQAETGAVLNAAAILVCTTIGIRGHERTDKIAMGAMNLNTIISGVFYAYSRGQQTDFPDV